MPRLTDPAAIRAILETDRAWSLYALGDLAPDLFPRCEWFAPVHGEPALLLLYRAFETPVLFTLGPSECVVPLLDEIDVARMYLHIRPDILPAVHARYGVPVEQRMWRMVLDPVSFSARPGEAVDLLTMSDMAAMQRLYADGDAGGEAPDFFAPEMVAQGVFRGVREDEALIAVGGTHLVVRAEGVAAVGNIYTRRDRRGQGLATRVTGAVTGALLHMGLRTIGLNVNQRNASAIHVYENLGFVHYCEFIEGVATR